MKIKVLTFHYERVSSRFTWGEGFTENIYEDNGVKCLIPENTPLSVKEAQLIIGFSQEPTESNPNWEYSEEYSRKLAEKLGEQWHGGDYNECKTDGAKAAQEVIENFKKDYQSFYPHITSPFFPRDEMKSSIESTNNSTKPFYKRYIDLLPNDKLDDEICFSIINYLYVGDELKKAWKNIVIPFYDTLLDNIKQLRMPITNKMKDEVYTDFWHHELKSFVDSFENNCGHEVDFCEEKPLGSPIAKAMVPPLDIAMFYYDVEWVWDLLKRGAKKTMFSDLSLQLVESKYAFFKDLSNYHPHKEYKIQTKDFFQQNVPNKILHHYFEIRPNLNLF